MLMLLASICQSRSGPKHSKLECGAAGQWFPHRRERSPHGCFLQEPPPADVLYWCSYTENQNLKTFCLTLQISMSCVSCVFWIKATSIPISQQRGAQNEARGIILVTVTTSDDGSERTSNCIRLPSRRSLASTKRHVLLLISNFINTASQVNWQTVATAVEVAFN